MLYDTGTLVPCLFLSFRPAQECHTLQLCDQSPGLTLQQSGRNKHNDSGDKELGPGRHRQ